MLALENTPQQHNVVVCTLCSFYRRYHNRLALLGLPAAHLYQGARLISLECQESRGVLLNSRAA